MSTDLEVQKAIRERLATTPAVTDLVPASHILDTSERPAPVPSILLGDSQVIDEGTSLTRSHARVYHNLHVWTREPSLAGAKRIAGAVSEALRARLTLPPGLHCGDIRTDAMRFLRDPDGAHSHAVITVNVLVSGKQT